MLFLTFLVAAFPKCNLFCIYLFMKEWRNEWIEEVADQELWDALGGYGFTAVITCWLGIAATDFYTTGHNPCSVSLAYLSSFPIELCVITQKYSTAQPVSGYPPFLVLPFVRLKHLRPTDAVYKLLLVHTVGLTHLRWARSSGSIALSHWHVCGWSEALRVMCEGRLSYTATVLALTHICVLFSASPLTGNQDFKWQGIFTGDTMSKYVEPSFLSHLLAELLYDLQWIQLHGVSAISSFPDNFWVCWSVPA